MSARQSAAVDKALRLFAKSGNKSEACRKAGIAWTTLYRALKRQKKREQAK